MRRRARPSGPHTEVWRRISSDQPQEGSEQRDTAAEEPSVSSNGNGPHTPTQTQDQEKKQRRLAPPDADIPTMGWPKLRYAINKGFNRADLVPALSEKERRLLERDRSIEALMHLSDRAPSFTTCFINAKGGAATTTTMVHVASIIADLLRGTVVATDFNKASGTSGVRLGRDYDETITLRQLRQYVKSAPDEDFKSFMSRLRQTPYGVRVVSSDSIISDRQHLAATDAVLLLQAIQRNCEYHLIDTANDITNGVTLEVIKASDPLVFTANVAMQDSLRQLAISMETLRKHGFTEQVDNSVIVISNLPKGKRLDDYRRYVNLHNINDVVVREIPFQGQLLGVPHDPVIARDTEVSLEDLDWETYQAYLEVALAIFEQAPQNRVRKQPAENRHD
jgi:cellulose biosynthesis protein BcsQ